MPKNSESNGRFMYFPANTATGPAMIEITANGLLQRFGKNSAAQRGAKIAAALRPMDIKAKFRIVSPKGPMLSTQASIKTMTIQIRPMSFSFSTVLNLSVNLNRTLRFSTKDIPRASPAPVAMMDMKSVPSTMPD